MQTFFRTATRDVELGGATILEGEKVLMLLGAANRDPRKWPDPDHYDIDRQTAGHVGFGAGVHMCVGRCWQGWKARRCSARSHAYSRASSRTARRRRF